MSREFDVNSPGISTVSISFLRKKLQLSQQKTLKILRFCDQKAKLNQSKDVAFFTDIQKDHVIINCKKLAKLCDNHTQKLIKDTSKSLQSNFKTTSSHRSKKKEVRSKTIKKDIKKKVFLKPYLGEFKNVKLTLEELKKLKTKFPDIFKDKIENLSHYVESTGKQYKSHYATILNWDRKNVEEQEKPTVRSTRSKYPQCPHCESFASSIQKGKKCPFCDKVV